MLLYITDSKKTKHPIRVEGIESITFENNPAIITFNYLNGSKKELHMVEQDFKAPSENYVVDKLWKWVASGLIGKQKQLSNFLGKQAKVADVKIHETNLDHSDNKTYLRISKFHDKFVEKKVIPIDDVTGVLADGIDSVVITTKGKDYRIVLVYEYNNVYSSDSSSKNSATNIIANQLSEIVSSTKKQTVSIYNPIEFISFEYEDESLEPVVTTVATDASQVTTVNTKKLHDISLYGFDIWDTCSLDMPFNSIEKTLPGQSVRVFENDLYEEDHTIRNFVLNVDNYGDAGNSSLIGKLRVMSNKLKVKYSEINWFPFVADGVNATTQALPVHASYNSSTSPMPDNNLAVAEEYFKDSSGNFGSNTTFADVHPYGDVSTAPYFSFDYYTNQNLKGTNKYTGSWSPVHTSIFYNSNMPSDGIVTALHNTSLGLDKSVRFHWIDTQTGSPDVIDGSLLNFTDPESNIGNLPGHYMLCKEDGVYKVRISLSHIAQAFYKVEDPGFNNGDPAWIAGALSANTPEQDFNMYVACNTYSAPIHHPYSPEQIIDAEGTSTTVRQVSEKAKEILSNNGADEEDYVFISHSNVTTSSKMLVHRNIMGPFKTMPNTGTISGYAEFIIPAKKNQTYFELDFIFQNNTYYSGDNDNIGGEAKVVINVDKLKNNSDNEVFKGIWNRYRAVSVKSTNHNEYTGITVEDDRIGYESPQGHHPLGDYLYTPGSGGTQGSGWDYDTKSFETNLSEINPGAAYNLSYMSIEKISDLDLDPPAAADVLSENVSTERGIVPLKGVAKEFPLPQVETPSSGYSYGYGYGYGYGNGQGIGAGNL